MRESIALILRLLELLELVIICSLEPCMGFTLVCHRHITWGTTFAALATASAPASGSSSHRQGHQRDWLQEHQPALHRQGRLPALDQQAQLPALDQQAQLPALDQQAQHQLDPLGDRWQLPGLHLPMEPAFLRAAGPSGALSPDAKAKVLSSKAASICKAKPPAAEAAPVPADPQEADEEEYVTVEVEAEVPIAMCFTAPSAPLSFRLSGSLKEAPQSQQKPTPSVATLCLRTTSAWCEG
ncbi:hypothetical protein AK812_SmicGene8145 [Symbiodinium microadriaticum]|uniref:Uncharacterized protein n=1 Tax=Symbiodinium microadriaticum TaxID=2951 RepID=A0A1Q9ELQ8_SYMMI|nr:hypothetical protein AK812_SmicGene8145 [Symbiodinium microadriaticum]